jgi:predicted aconitase with swiveling domain
MTVKTLIGRGAIGGKARGRALVSRETFQGDSAIDIATGRIIQVGHPLEGETLTGAVLVLDGGKGSTGWSCRLHAAVVRGVGPAAMIFPRMDARTAGAAAAADIPVVTDTQEDPFLSIATGDWVTVDGDRGEIIIEGEQ